MPTCIDCGSYLRKLKTKKTKELTFDEANKLVEHFKTGDISTVQAVMAWGPPERALDRKSQRAPITYNLFGCPKCQAEAISVSVSAFTGKEWNDVPGLKTRRDLASGFSLRDRLVSPALYARPHRGACAA